MTDTGDSPQSSGASMQTAIELVMVCGGGGLVFAHYYKNSPSFRSSLALAKGNSRMQVAGLGLGAVLIGAAYFGTVAIEARKSKGGRGEDLDINDPDVWMTSSGTLQRADNSEPGQRYTSLIDRIPPHIFAYAVPLALAPTAHLMISIAQSSHGLRKPLIIGAVIASVAAVAQRLYLMEDSWQGESVE